MEAFILAVAFGFLVGIVGQILAYSVFHRDKNKISDRKDGE